jgi:hypothetical protein
MCAGITGRRKVALMANLLKGKIHNKGNIAAR